MTFGYELIVMAITLGVNSFFASYEMALASISRTTLQTMAQARRKGAAETLFMKDRMEASLAVCQVGMTLMSSIAAAVGGAGVGEYLSPFLTKHFGISEPLSDVLALVFLIIPFSIFTIIFAELIPKTYAIKHQARVCLALSPGMKVLTHIGYPVIFVLEAIVKKFMELVDRRHKQDPQASGLHELNAAVALARTSRLLGARQEKIVLSAAQFSFRPVKEIMVPIKDVSMIPADVSLSEALIRAHNDMHTRFPVAGANGKIEGYVNFKDIIAALKLNPSDPSIKGILRPLNTFAGQTPISQVLEKMIQEKLHIALVTSNDEVLGGIVTLEDIMEELVGEIEDEFDRLPSYIHTYSGGWIIGCGILMSTFAHTAGVGSWGLSEDEWGLKFADWIEKKLGRAPHPGEVIEHNGYQVTVRKMRRKRLGEAFICAK